MTAYTKSTNFATKDTLTSGDPLKIVKGTEINTEFDNIATAVNSKSDTASPTFTGTVTIPTLALSGLTASSAVATNASNALVSVTNTGTGNNVLATSPTLVTPILGTPTSGTLTNATGLPLTTGVTGVLPEANGGTGTTTGYYGFKNRIINGAMTISQAAAGASITPAATGTSSVNFAVDRTRLAYSQNSKLTAQQNRGSVTPPAGFKNYLGVGVASTATVGATDYFLAGQPIEGYNISDLAWGTASAATVTLSFWVYSNTTGTFGGAVNNSAYDRSYVFSYTINVANTWEQKTVTIAGDTSGTWLTDNSAGIRIWFSLGTGSTLSKASGSWGAGEYYSATGATSLMGNTSNYLYITGVQLEKGSTATSFDYRPYTTELQLAQRYYQTSTVFVSGSADSYYGVWAFKVSMRAAPTIAGGAAGFVAATTANTEMWSGYQTTRNFQILTASIEL